MNDSLLVSALSILPKNQLTSGMGWFARRRWPQVLLQPLLRWYVAHYQVDLGECNGDLASYTSLSEFFTRPLRVGARPVAAGPDLVVSPADAKVASIGSVQGGRVPQAGTLQIDVPTLLDGDHAYDDGEFVVLYLSPPDYHRVHAPLQGRLTRWVYRPGRLFPVFQAAAAQVVDLFARNERLISWFSTEAGRVALVMVGAFGVGRIEMLYTDLLSNTGRATTRQETPDGPSYVKGQEIGRFNLGSTVILFFPRGSVRWEVELGQKVKVGQRLARLVRA